MPISRMAGAMGLPTGKGRVWNSINQTLASNLLATGRDLRDPQLSRSRKCLEQHKSNPCIYYTRYWQRLAGSATISIPKMFGTV